MPLTPLHLGPGLGFWFVAPNFFNIWAVFFGSLIPDLEPSLLVLINRCYHCTHHGFFHSILGAFFGSLVLAGILRGFKNQLNEISLKFKLNQNFSFKNLFFSSFLAWLVHIFFDSFAHSDVFLFWPNKWQPTLIGKKVYWPLSFFFFLVLIFLYARYKIYPPKSRKD